MPSFADAAMYYETHMLSTFSDGVYYDDVFFHTNYNTVPGPGHIGDDGSLKPGVNLWAWRQFMKRTAVLQHMMGKSTTAIWMHMTNWNVMPVLSWGSINFDWEWRAGLVDGVDLSELDVQTRNNIGCDDHGLRRWGCRPERFRS